VFEKESAGLQPVLERDHTDRNDLPCGVEIVRLTSHADSRGVFTEVFRDEWPAGIRPVQWNLVHSNANVLRGVHVHRRHEDYLVAASGRIHVGLCDLRSDSPTFLSSVVIELVPDPLRAIRIPVGVAHGFYFPAPSIHLYAVSQTWDPSDELGCRWNDPSLPIPWSIRDPHLSERDRSLPSLADLLRELDR
jgi:dTDP-4-dehydrorhamnose 3,5-epimerase